MAKLQLKHELIRKALHVSSLWIPILYFFTDYMTMFNLLFFLSCIAIFIDIFRHHKSKLGMNIRVGLKYFNLDSLFKEHEYRGAFCGATYMLLTGLLCLMLFPMGIFIIAFSVMVLSDSCASIAGRFFGKHKVFTDKSWEGFAAFLLSALIISVLLCSAFNYSIVAGIVASLLAAGTELASQKLMKLDDNFTVPIVYGVTLASINTAISLI